MKKLILNADDYGLTAGTSAAIRESHLRGILTSTTTMMNFPNAEDALRRAALDCPNLGLGVHLVLTGGAPLLPAADVPSLVDAAGKFYGEKAFIQRLDTIHPAEVEAEWRAQVGKFVGLTGHAPDHLDAHHHVAYFAPALFELLLKLAQEYRCGIRLPMGETFADVLGGLPETQAHRMLAALPALLKVYEPCHPDRFVVSFYNDITEANLYAILASLDDGMTEIMCHPAYNDAELAKVSIYTDKRALELALLTQPSVLKHVQASAIELVSFRQLCS
ncbi:MAG: ChbG/HpnK family deacetylase [Chloroflexota bacterium]